MGRPARRTATGWLQFTAAALFAAVLGGTGPAEAETVRIARQLGISYLPLLLMQDGGLLEQEGRARGLDLTVDWITFTGGPPINDALISGPVDLAAGGVGPMPTPLTRTQANLRVKGVAALCSMPIWLNTNNPAIRTIADFTDRDRIALPGVKVSIQAVVLQMAALDRAMAIINDRPADAAAAWVRSERSRLTAAEAAGMISRPENEWTTPPRCMMAFATFMHATGGLPQRPANWQELFFPAIHMQDGSRLLAKKTGHA